ncbi:phage protein NinX family protein [Burkholderia cepacia]|nr:phage protein NinX family protein [Burkholderia cepacia]
MTGALLDFWVARADGYQRGTVGEGVDAFNGGRGPIVFAISNGMLRVAKKEIVSDWAPSVDWTQGGPIIERARIQIVPQNVNHLRWSAYMDEGLRPGKFPVEQYGETLLIAAMRAYVASKFGDEVEGPTQPASEGQR